MCLYSISTRAYKLQVSVCLTVCLFVPASHHSSIVGPSVICLSVNNSLWFPYNAFYCTSITCVVRFSDFCNILLTFQNI